MRQVISTVLKSIISPLLTVVFLILALVVLQPYLLRTFSPPVALPVISPTPGTTTVITTTLGFSDALGTYEKVATTAIHASEQAVALSNWLIGIVAGLATLATAAAAYLYKTAIEASEKARLAESAAQAAREAAISVSNQLQSLLGRYDRLFDQYEQLREKTLSLDAALQAWDRGEISQDEVLETQQWGSWKKWKQDRDDTGWMELKEDADTGNLASPVRLAIEKELTRLQRRATKSNAEKEYEQKLQTLIHPLVE